MKHRQLHILYLSLLAAVVFVTFMLLDMQAVSCGDDFGYMFTDSTLHSGDGQRVNSFTECLATQYSHYFTTNGRFLVHVAVQYMVSVAPHRLFPLINALFFSLLWFTVLLQSNCGIRWQTGGIVWLMLWVLLPTPGVTMLSLKAYSVNYLWTSAAIFAIPLIAGRSGTKLRNIAVVIYVFITATLQESFSIPISAALIAYFFIFRKNLHINKFQRVVSITFLAGTLVCVAAPGNISHAIQGGGMAGDAFINRLGALAGELLYSPMIILAAGTLLLRIIAPHKCNKFIRKNSFLYLAIFFSLLLACATFTSSRQLFAPSLFSIVLLLRMSKLLHFPNVCLSIAGSCSLVITLSLLAGAYNIRGNTIAIWECFMNSLGSSESCDGWIDTSNSNYNHPERYHGILRRFDADPFANKELKIVFDSYTRNGISRLIGRKIYSVYPMNPDSIAAKAINHGIISGQSGRVATIDNAYSCFAVSGGFPKRIQTPADSKHHLPFACIKRGDIYIFVIPQTDSIVIVRK